MAKLQVRLVKSFIGRKERQRITARTLGLRKVNDVAVHDDTPAIRGMIDKVQHLVEVKEIAGEATLAAAVATGPSLEELGLSARLLNALHEAGINSIEELTAHTSSQLLAIKGFGAKSLEDVIEKLKALGLALRQE